MTTTTWIPLCKVEDIPVLGARRVARAAGSPVAVFRTADDRVFALLDRCPHKGGPLSQGIVFGDRVACPLHNWTIGLPDGCAQAPDVGCTATFAVQVVDGTVSLDAGELATKAVDDAEVAALACPSAPGEANAAMARAASASASASASTSDA